jgi:hypothetical protein
MNYYWSQDQANWAYYYQYGPYAAGASAAASGGPRSTWSPLPPPPPSASSSVPTGYAIPPVQHHQRQPSAVRGSQQPNVRSMLDVEDFRPPPPPRNSQPNLREEDYCPVCHKPLPPRRLDGNEDDREAHVDDCIQQSLYGSSSSNQRTNAIRRTSQVLPSTGTTAESSPSSTGSVQRHRRNTVGRMVTFPATEKDCVGEGGEGQAECIICFEDIEVGVKMARLECLCKFHEVCVTPYQNVVLTTIITNYDSTGLYQGMVGKKGARCLSCPPGQRLLVRHLWLCLLAGSSSE